jgi:predicted phage-related endonuclease
MSASTLTAKVHEYKEVSTLIAELDAIKNAIADELKAILTTAGQDTLTVGNYKVSYTDCFRRDIDKKALASDHADLYAEYIRETTYKRFTVA